MPINNNILNQKGTPAFYSDIFANRPIYGYAGRVFISTDTGAIYEDTGTSWTLIADAGAGTTGTLQQVTTNGNTTTLGITVQGIDINDGAGTGSNNIAIGAAALQNNTTGQANTALGISTLQYNTTGYQNTAFGSTALNANTTGGLNTAVGYLALNANTSANNNTAIGFESLKLNTTGANNTAIGFGSLKNNTTGGNTAIGYLSSTTNTTGVNNSSLGLSSLRLNTTGANNTAIGSIALQNNTTGSNNTAVGYASLTANTTGASNTAVGIESLIANTTGNNNVAVGNQSLGANTTGLQNTAIGVGALYLNTTASNNTAIGFNSLVANTSGATNTAIGSGTLTLNTTGINNTAIGQSSLAANITGSYNVALGVGTLGNNLGSYNVGIGHSSLNAVTTGTNNSAIGYASGSAITTGSNNTILGNYAGTSTLASNIVLSDGAGNVRLFSDANGLIGIGQAIGTPGGQLDIHTTQTYALVLNGTTTNNAYTAFSSAGVGKWRIGNTYNAGANSFDIFNLGTSATALSFSSTTNNLGIGTSPDATYKVKISGTDTIFPAIYFDNTTNSQAYSIRASGTSLSIRDNTSGNDRITLNTAGNVGIGNTAASDIRLYITGQSTTSSNYAIVAYNSGNQELLLIRNDGLYLTGTRTNSPYNYNVTFSPRSAGLDASGGLGYIVSTKESKGNIESIKNIDFVNKLNPVKFNYRKKNKDNTEFIDELHEDIYFGFIADEVEQINKDLVFYDNLQDGSKKLAGVHYNSIIAILTKSIQELNEKLVRNNIN